MYIYVRPSCSRTQSHMTPGEQPNLYYPSIYLYIYLSIYLSIHLSIHLSIYVYTNIYVYVYVYISVTESYSVIYDSGSVRWRAIFSPRETSPENPKTLWESKNVRPRLRIQKTSDLTREFKNAATSQRARRDGDHQLTVKSRLLPPSKIMNFLAEFQRLSVAFSMGTPRCPYMITNRRVYGVSPSGH